LTLVVSGWRRVTKQWGFEGRGIHSLQVLNWLGSFVMREVNIMPYLFTVFGLNVFAK
jgi:hypothetical protein